MPAKYEVSVTWPSRIPAAMASCVSLCATMDSTGSISTAISPPVFSDTLSAHCFCSWKFGLPAGSDDWKRRVMSCANTPVAVLMASRAVMVNLVMWSSLDLVWVTPESAPG